MRIHLVENPSAGPARGRDFLEAVADGLRGRGHEVSTYVAGAPGDLARHVAAFPADAFEHLFVAGGDGTLKEIVSARAGPFPWAIGIVPVGTANLVARDLALPLRAPPARCVDLLDDVEPWRVDLLRVRTGTRTATALATVGVGLDGAIVHAVAALRAEGGGGGYHRWIGPGLRTLRRHRFLPLRVTVDEARIYRVPQVIVQNASTWGGFFRLGPGARMDDGLMDVTLARLTGYRDAVRVGVGALTHRVHRDRRVVQHAARRLRVECDEPVPVQVDGDPGGFTDLEIEVLPAALTLLRPRAAVPT